MDKSPAGGVLGLDGDTLYLVNEMGQLVAVDMPSHLILDENRKLIGIRPGSRYIDRLFANWSATSINDAIRAPNSRRTRASLKSARNASMSASSGRRFAIAYGIKNSTAAVRSLAACAAAIVRFMISISSIGLSFVRRASCAESRRTGKEG